MTMVQLERRVRALEEEVASLKQVAPLQNGGAPKFSVESFLRNAGRFRDDPGFLEMVRLGRAYRESLRPNPRKRGKSRRAGS
jgi:hypothetical protein